MLPIRDAIALSKAISVVGSEQRLLILCCITAGQSRFNELKNFCGNPNSMTLSRSLRALERSGLIKRKMGSHHEIDYSLTELGAEFSKVVNALERWGQKALIESEHIKLQWHRL